LRVQKNRRVLRHWGKPQFKTRNEENIKKKNNLGWEGKDNGPSFGAKLGRGGRNGGVRRKGNNHLKKGVPSEKKNNPRGKPAWRKGHSGRHKKAVKRTGENIPTAHDHMFLTNRGRVLAGLNQRTICGPTGRGKAFARG